MSLSDDEQRLLAELEAALYDGDPGFADRLSGRRAGRRGRAAAGVAVVLLLVGAVGMFVGVSLFLTLVGVAGFVAMLAGGVLLYRALSRPAYVSLTVGSPSAGRLVPGRPAGGAMRRLERRWEERQRRRDEEEGGGF